MLLRLFIDHVFDFEQVIFKLPRRKINDQPTYNTIYSCDTDFQGKMKNVYSNTLYKHT